MTIETLTRDVADLKRRLDLAETKLSQQAGQFEFISGQLRDIQLYVHARFSDVDKKLAEQDERFDRVDVELAEIKTEVKALPRAIAELIANR